MGYVNTVKELALNMVAQNKGTKITNADAEALTNGINLLESYTDSYYAAINQVTWADATLFTPMTKKPLEDVRQLLKYYDRTYWLSTFLSEEVYIGAPNLNNIKNKKDFLDSEDIIVYIGRGGVTGSLTEQESEIHRMYYYNDTEWRVCNGGIYYQLVNLFIGNYASADGVSINLTRPLFNISFGKSNIDEVINISTSINFLNVYAAVNTESTEIIETNYYIKDDLDDSKFHIFRVYNKNQLMQLLTLFKYEYFYSNSDDLKAGTNAIKVEFTDDVDTKTEPNLLTNPGQTQNQVKNQQNGTGDWSVVEVTTPQNPYTGTGIGNCLYAINLRQMYKVREELFSPDIISSFFVDNESLLGCTIWPFKYSGDGLYTVTNLKIGKYTTPLTGQEGMVPYAYAILPTYVPKVYVAQGVSILPKNGNFLDYAPYTKIQFYLPYVGIVDVDPCDIYNHTLDIYYLYEPTTGKGKACIKSNSGVTYSWDCMLGTSVPFTISNMNQLMQNLALGGIKAAGIYATGGLGMIGEMYSATEVISGIAGSIRDFKISSTGGTGDSMGRLEPQDVYCITHGPKTRIPDDYNKNYGRPSLITVTLNKLKGFTTVPNPLFTTTATDTEKDEIVNLLKAGVIINGQAE